MTRRPDSLSRSSATSQQKVTPADARVTIRLATPADAAGIVACNVASWREAYSSLLSPEFLARQDAAERASIWIGALADDRNRVAIATIRADGAQPDADADAAPPATGRTRTHRPIGPDPPAEEVVGFAACRRATTGRSRQARARVDVHPPGVPRQRDRRRLFDLAVGDGPCALWVAERNPRAIAFYRKCGFGSTGSARPCRVGATCRSCGWCAEPGFRRRVRAARDDRAVPVAGRASAPAGHPTIRTAARFRPERRTGCGHSARQQPTTWSSTMPVACISA